jgi:4-amino-4-deoxy-L-arabinose transferase-like glycosyltransferase
MIAHLLHGSPTPSFGQYFSGVPAIYAVPAALLDHLGGPALVRGANTILVLAATILVYLAARRLFGQGAGLLAAAVFAINPATIFLARFASVDAACILTLAAALYLATNPVHHRLFPLLTGGLLATAVAEKYVAVLFVPGALAIAFGATAHQLGRRPAGRRLAVTAVATVVAVAGWAAIAHNDWRGFASNALGGRILDEVAGTALLHDGWNYVGGIALCSVLAIAALRGRRRLTALFCAVGLVPIGVQIASQQSASLQRNIGLSMLFLAPVLGALGAWLVTQGRLLGIRAPLALVGAVTLLSSGMGTSDRMIHAWPTSTSIDSALRYYAHNGGQRYLVDGSSLPAYYLSDVTNYNQWASTLDQLYATASGVTRLRQDIESADYRLVLYRDNGATPDLDRSMLTALQTRYTLVAKVPVSQDDKNAYWSLWLAELPR